MKIAVMSREQLEKTARNPFPEKTAVISISDSDAPPPELRHAPAFLLPLVFDDMDPESELLDDLFTDLPGTRMEYRVITDRQAQEIALFARKMHTAAALLICQCEFGQSRSAAVAAAVTEYFNGNGIEIFADIRYSPNKYVFRKVYEQLRALP